MSTPPRAGDPAPDFSLPDPEGREHSLGAWRGRPVALIFLRHSG